MNSRRDSVGYGANSVNPSTSFWTNDSGDAELLFNYPQTTSQTQGNDQQLNVAYQPSLIQVENLLLAEKKEPNLLAGQESWSENGCWGSYIFQNADTEIQNLSARNSSGKNSSSDNWSRVSDTLGNSWNSASASPTPLASSSQDSARKKLDQDWNIDQLFFWEMGNTNLNSITIDHDDQIERCPAPLPTINTDSGNQQAEKRKGFSSPNRLSDKSMSSEGDADDASLSDGSSGDKRKTGLAVEKPVIGMGFLSEEEAYEFYRHYASQMGFRVRKGKVQRLADQKIRKRLFYCSKEGFRSKKQSNKITKYTRIETRTGCEAMIQLTVEDEKWVISKVVLGHNHVLGNCRERPGLAMDLVQTTTEVANEIKVPKCDGLQGRDDCIQDMKLSNLQPEDCHSLKNYLNGLQAEEPSFFYQELQVDHGRKQIPNLFWRDGRSKMDYYCFGDVLVLNTAFRMDKHEMICVAFSGLNHHQQHILFGCAFLIDETKESFFWLLRIFMEAMGSREPKTIFTDEGQQMADAIKLVLPQTKHCLGTWCIWQNAPKQLPKHFEQPGFKCLFYRCIFDCQSWEEFESLWESLEKKYKLQDNSWVHTLYRLRHQWSHIFAENAFSAGIQSVQDTENITNIFQDITSEMSLPDIAQQYQKSAARMRTAEQSEDSRCLESVPVMILRSNIEKQAADVYTSAMFKIFQEELRRCLSVKIEEKQSHGKITSFNLVEEGDKREYTVAFNKLDFKITCGCGKFESVGILCVHALKVLNRQNIFEIPHQYILNRWRKDARNRVLMDAAEAADKHVRLLNPTENKLGLDLSRILAKSAGNDECLKLVESCFDKVEKQVDRMLKANSMKEHTNSIVVEAGDSNAQTVFKLPHANQKKGSKGKEKESYGGHNHHSDVEEITSDWANYSQAPMVTKSTSASQDSKMSTDHTAKVSRSMSTGSDHFGRREGMVSKVRSTAAKIIGLGPMGKNKDRTPI